MSVQGEMSATITRRPKMEITLCAITLAAIAAGTPATTQAGILECDNASDLAVSVYGVSFDKMTLSDARNIFAGSWTKPESFNDKRFVGTSNVLIYSPKNTDADVISISYISEKRLTSLNDRVFALGYMYRSSGFDPKLKLKGSDILSTLKARYGEPCDQSTTSLEKFQDISVKFGGKINISFSYHTGSANSNVSVDFWNQRILDALTLAEQPGADQAKDSSRAGAPF